MPGMTRPEFIAMMKAQAKDCAADAAKVDAEGTGPYHTKLAAFIRGEAAAFESCARLMEGLIWEEDITARVLAED